MKNLAKTILLILLITIRQTPELIHQRILRPIRLFSMKSAATWKPVSSTPGSSRKNFRPIKKRPGKS